MSIKNNTTQLQDLLNKVNALPDAGGVELPELTNEGSASDLLSGKQLIDGEGNVVTGNIPTKTSSNLTASGATVTVPAGYYASDASKSVATATQATPSISVSTSGLITASATQTAGYVSAGTKSGTKQLTTKAAATITPTKSSQTAVAANVYTTGAVTVAAIPSKYQDVSSVTAGAGDVLTGKKIVNSSGTVVSGTMANNGTMNKTMDGITVKSVTIPAGYTTGGSVSLDNTIDNEVTTQTNLISQIKNKVNSLPDGNGGSSTTNVETCTITFYNPELGGLEGTIYYVDKNLTFQTLDLVLGYEESTTIEVLKNSIMCSSNCNLVDIGETLFYLSPGFVCAVRVTDDVNLGGA